MSELPYLAQALLKSDSYPDSPSTVKLVQNPTSYVFLTGDYAYKIKRPVNNGYLDYTTLEKRRFYCDREIVLNKRLCPDIYIDTIPVTEEKNGLSVEGKGKVIEYAVKMRQMSQEDMLDSLLASKSVPEKAMDDIARKMAVFHEKATASNIINDYGDLEFILTNTENNFINTIRYIGNTITQKRFRYIKEYTNSFMQQNTALFDERIAGGKIRDCHGDVRVEHICINSDVYIFDCIEYNDSLRYCDIASEIALLAVDLDGHDNSSFSRSFIDSYISITGDEDLPRMINFYKCYRAYERGRIESMKLGTPGVTGDKKEECLRNAERYFELAESYI